jgi:hypothetical protein
MARSMLLRRLVLLGTPLSLAVRAMAFVTAE